VLSLLGSEAEMWGLFLVSGFLALLAYPRAGDGGGWSVIKGGGELGVM
jgi:hypothetical protein